MSLDLNKLENVKSSNGKLTARCPACAENNDDKTGNHLFVADDGEGPFGCILFPGGQGIDHRKRIYALAHSDVSPAPSDQTHTKPRPLSAPMFSAGKNRPPPVFPPLHKPPIENLDAIKDLRGWQLIEGLELLVQRNLLFHADVYDAGAEWPAWVISDSKRMHAQARTYDGSMWPGIKAKAKTLPGSIGAWPIGAPDIGERPCVILCEGQPDFCAALTVAWCEVKAEVDKFAPVCMAGAGNSIPSEQVPCFSGKHIRIVAHNDPPGTGAARRWAQQLSAVSDHVDVLHFGNGILRADGVPIKDLADFTTLLGTHHAPEFRCFTNMLRP